MTESLEWDWPPTKRYHKRRRARIEALPPEQDEREPRPQRVEIIFTRSRQQSTTNWPVLMVAVVAVLFFWRYSFALLLIGVIAWKLVAAMLMITVVVSLAAWRERRHGRQF
jgi:hypothetical protein